MTLRQMRTLIAFLNAGSFIGAGEKIGLSHSAVSVQMRQLEDELGVTIFNRSTKPPQMTPLGEKLALMGRDVLAQIERIRLVASGEDVAGSISIGVVPTTLQSVLPAILNELRNRYPKLQVGVRSGLSGELAAAVVRHEIDFAILTSPAIGIAELEVTEIASEPLYVIGPRHLKGAESDVALALSMPFIAFNKRSWLGQQITSKLQSRRIFVAESMEVDSLDAIEKLVADGFGVSIVPQRLLAKPLSSNLIRIPFGNPVEARTLVLIQHLQTRNPGLQSVIREIVLGLAKRPGKGGTPSTQRLRTRSAKQPG